MIDLFKLHDYTEDKGAYSWIVVDGPKVFPIFKQLINEITEKLNCSLLSLSKRVSKRIGCSDSMLYDIFNDRTKWISLRLVDDLLTILRELDENEKAIKIKNEFLNSIKFLKSTPRSTVKIKAVKKLSPEIAELCGIHAADGSLNLAIDIESKKKRYLVRVKDKLLKRFPEIRISKIRRTRNKTKYGLYFYVINKTREKILNYLNKCNIGFSLAYKIELVDFGKDSMEYLRKLVASQFGYNVKIKTGGGGNWYFVLFSNKIIGRYLKSIFNFPLGKKSSVVDAPELIKSELFLIQKAFVRGLMQFDGSVKRNGNVALSTNSKHLLDFFLSTIKKDNLKGAAWARKNRKKELTFESPPSKQWLTYFIKNTLKYQRLHEHIYGFEGKAKTIDGAIKNFDITFPLGNRSTLLFSKLIKEISKLKEFTRYQVSDKLGIHYKSLSVMLDILENAKIIKVDCVEMPDRFKKKSDKITFNNNIEAWRIPLLQNNKQWGGSLDKK